MRRLRTPHETTKLPLEPTKRGDNLDRSSAGAVEVGRARQTPPPPDAPPDRHTVDAKRRR